MKKKNNENFFLNVKRTWKYIKECKSNLIYYAIVSIVEAIIGAILPIFSAKIILNMTEGIINQLILSAFAVFVIEMILYLMYFLKGVFYNKIYQKTLVSLQIAIARETLKLKVEEIDKSSSGVFIDRLNKDTKDISGLFMEYTYWISYVLSNVGVLVAVFVLNKYMFFYAVITSIVVFVINKISLSKRYTLQKEINKIHEKKTSLTSELVRGIRDIKVLNASETILNQTSNRIKEEANEEVKNIKTQRLYSYIENSFKAMSNFILILLGCLLFKNNLITIPVFVIIFNYQSKIKNLLIGIVQILEFNKKFNLAADRIYEIIENVKFKKEDFGNTLVKKIEGNIEFKDVDFGYDENKKIIDKMSFVIKPNEKVAFVGKSGAGKTTIFNLITKLYEVNSGEILLDGFNINSLTCSSIRDNMSIITQNPYIFNFSIKDNLLLVKKNASMKEIREACKLASIDDYIMSLPEKYDTLVGENGIILSGGQKQRIAIARALLMKTEILLFDEATSALDNETQSEIQTAIENLKGEYTILIIAHRLSTVVDSDTIFVVNEGKIIDSGNHKELLKRCEFYKELYQKDLEI